MDHSDIGFVPTSNNTHEDLGFVPSSSNDDISKLESGLRGAAEGASFGFAPAITGALDAIPSVGGALTGQNSLQDILDTYNRSRAESKARNDAAAKANPLSYFGGSLVGGLAPALLTGGASEAATGASALENGATMGLKYGALSGAGNAISSGPKDLGDVAEGAIRGGATGAVMGGALSRVAESLGAIPDAAEEMGNERALKSTGIMKGQLKALQKTDNKANMFQAAQGVAPEEQNTIQEVGGLLLEKNPYQDSPVVTALSTPEDIMERTNDLIPKVGKEIGNTLTTLDQSFNNQELAPKFFNPTDAAAEIERQLMPQQVNGQTTPVAQPVANFVQKIIDTVKMYGDGPIPFAKAQELKNSITSLAKYNIDGSNTNQLLKEAGGIINAHIEAAADDVAQAVEKPELYEKYLQDKQLYKAAKITNDASTGKTAANMVNRDFGITDYMSGIAAAAHGAPGVAAAALANKGLRSYGNPLLATAGKTISNVSNRLSNVSRTITNIPKEQIAQFGEQLAQQSDPLSQKLGGVLSQVKDRDDIGRNALMFSIMQNPSYRELMNKYFGDDTQNVSK